MLIFARVLRAATAGGVRRASTEAIGAAASPGAGNSPAILDHLPWRTIAITAAGGAIGFFGKILHDDNLATRAELQAVREDMKGVRKEAREDIQALEARVDKRFDKVEASLQEISGYLRPAPRK